MSDKEQPGANKAAVGGEANKLPRTRTSPKIKQKSNSPENERKREDNVKLPRPFSAMNRKETKVLVKPKETKEMLLRRDFQIGLNKLATSETREMGMKELQNIISSNNTPQDLRVFLSILCDQKRNLNSMTKEMEVLVFGNIALVFKDNLMDPLDKPPNLVKSVIRICEAVHSYFKDTSPGVQSACARALCEIYSNCLQHESMETVRLVIVEPLLSILNGGGDKITQHTAAVCLCEFVYLAKQLGKIEIIDGVCEKLYNLLMKTNHDFVELLRGIGISIAVNKLAGLSNKLVAMINKLCGIISAQNNSNQYYLNKVEACTTLLIIAKVLVNQNVPLQDDLKKTYDKVVGLLKDASTHRIQRVQKAAAETLKQWEILGKRDASTLSQEMGDKILLPEEEEALKPKKSTPKRPSHKVEVPVNLSVDH